MDVNEERTILIVDDDPRNLEVLSGTLSGAGFDIAVAMNGTRAVELATQLARKAGAPDLILLDVRMEGIDGYETCRRLKADRATSDIPVIFMTASAEQAADRVKGLRLGAVDFIHKPFQGEELLARVHVHIKLRRTMKSLAAQVEERLAAEAALHKLAQELENRVTERTAELEKALGGLTQAEAALRKANVELETEVARRTAELRRTMEELRRTTEELRRTNERLTLELGERERVDKARAALQEEVIRAQRARLAELSTPLIPITDDIMVMPLIGTIDADRAQQALEAALNGVHASGAGVVLIDVTGVTMIDSAVARTLVNTATALRLLGGHTVITGIRPNLARALAALDVELSGVVTMGTLMSGIDYALRERSALGHGRVPATWG